MSKFSLIIILFTSINTFAQKIDTAKITQLNKLGKIIIDAQNDEAKYKANKTYKIILKEIVNNPNSFNFSFDSLKDISILKANNLKVYNWVLPKVDGTFEYFALLQIKVSKGVYKTIELIDQSDQIKLPESKILTPQNWYGALYYKIIYNKKIGKNTYTILGWDGNDNLTNKKIIDVITVTGNGNVKLGAAIFKTKKKIKKRVIFEYSDNAVMSLKYNPKLKKIIFDYLVPVSSELKGIYAYYGPILNRFDAYTIENRKWIYEKDTPINLDRSIKDFMWKDPKK